MTRGRRMRPKTARHRRSHDSHRRFNGDLHAGGRRSTRLRTAGRAGGLSVGAGQYRRESRSDDGRLGVITLHSLSHATALTVSATTLEAPANARKAYDRGIDALAKQKLDAAADELTKAVTAYPKFAIAWYQLGPAAQKRMTPPGPMRPWKQALASDPSTSGL